MNNPSKSFLETYFMSKPMSCSCRCHATELERVWSVLLLSRNTQNVVNCLVRHLQELDTCKQIETSRLINAQEPVLRFEANQCNIRTQNSDFDNHPI
jgi:hypothetical protein